MKHLAFLSLVCAALAAQTAPFAITSMGTIDRSTFPEIRNGERYAIWRMNNDAGVVYTQTAFTGTTAAGSATMTNADG